MTSKLDSPKHLISLRALRLNRPMLATVAQPSAESENDHFAAWLAQKQETLHYHIRGLASDSGLTVGGPSELLSLPQSFGTLFLGETFSCHINLHNDSQFDCKNLVLKVSIRNRSKYAVLSTTSVKSGRCLSAKVPVLSGNPQQFADSGSSLEREDPNNNNLKSQESLNVVISHEMKELGEHTLTCSVTYTVASSSLSTIPGQVFPTPRVIETGSMDSELTTLTFQKNFNFPVEKPFDVVTNIVTDEKTSSTFIEAQIENLMPFPIVLHKISLDPGLQLRAIDLNQPGSQKNCIDPIAETKKAVSLHSKYSSMQSHDVWRFLYQVQPLRLAAMKSFSGDATTISPNTASNLGQLDITWKSSMGDIGHLQTSQFSHNPRHVSELDMRVLDLPSKVEVETPFQLVCELTNRSSRPLELLLSRPSEKLVESKTTPFTCLTGSGSQPFIWTGVTHRRLEVLSPGSSTILHIDLIPLLTGLQELIGLYLKEVSTGRVFTFDEIGHLLVTARS